MKGSVRLEIERLAPTGEGVARLHGKTVFVEGALAGEIVEAELFGEKSRFARARTLAVERPSADRRGVDAHSSRCGGTDWAHFEPVAARKAKRDLFLETMQRIGGLDRAAFGELPISDSPLEYRLRNQFHRRGDEVGFFERHSHRIVPIDNCEIVSARTRGAIAAQSREWGSASAGSRETGAIETIGTIETIQTIETIEAIETVETGPTHAVAFWNRSRQEPAGGNPKIEIRCEDAAFSVSPRAFFQINRFRFPALMREVERRARSLGQESSLDTYSGVGLFTHALAEAGLSVTAVEGSRESVALARDNRIRLREPDPVRIVGSSVEAFLAGSAESFDLVLADPPRAGLGSLAADLARRARTAFFYVSCDPASLARDLRSILPLGFEIESSFLEDFFPLTHRVEAFVALRRAR